MRKENAHISFFIILRIDSVIRRVPFRRHLYVYNSKVFSFMCRGIFSRKIDEFWSRIRWRCTMRWLMEIDQTRQQNIFSNLLKITHAFESHYPCRYFWFSNNFQPNRANILMSLCKIDQSPFKYMYTSNYKLIHAWWKYPVWNKSNNIILVRSPLPLFIFVLSVFSS